MESITLPQNHPHYSELKQLTDNLLSFIDADSIYLSPGDSVQERKTIISLIVKKGSSQTSEELFNVTEKLFASYPQFACKVFEADWAEYSLRKGNLFFLRHCSKKELVYSNPESTVSINPTAQDLKQLIKKARGRYTKSSDEIDTISKELPLYIKNGNHLQAAYILHQTIRKLLYTASWFLAGESIPSMSITVQQRYIKPFSGYLGTLFDPNDLKDTLLLEQLDGACDMVRNNKKVTIIKESIPAITAKAEWLQKQVQKLFEETVRICEGKFDVLDNNAKTKASDRASDTDDKKKKLATETLDMLQELASVHFKKLKSDKKKEGVYTAKIQLVGYADLMCLISDLIKVSISAYNDNEENGYDREGVGSELIINPKVNIANILEMILQLLPIEEAEYLDVLNEVFIGNLDNDNKG